MIGGRARVRQEGAAGREADRPPPPWTADANRPPAPPTPVNEPQPVPVDPAGADALASRDLDAINKNSPFQPLFFALDQSEVSVEGQQVLNANAEIMKKYPTWVITIEGHADERGTAEYNLALGERRALAARNYLVSLGIPADRLRTVSYGKEFPFDPAQDRRGVREEPPRAFCCHEQVDGHQLPTPTTKIQIEMILELEVGIGLERRPLRTL